MKTMGQLSALRLFCLSSCVRSTSRVEDQQKLGTNTMWLYLLTQKAYILFSFQACKAAYRQ